MVSRTLTQSITVPSSMTVVAIAYENISFGIIFSFVFLVDVRTSERLYRRQTSTNAYLQFFMREMFQLTNTLFKGTAYVFNTHMVYKPHTAPVLSAIRTFALVTLQKSRTRNAFRRSQVYGSVSSWYHTCMCFWSFHNQFCSLIVLKVPGSLKFNK